MHQLYANSNDFRTLSSSRVSPPIVAVEGFVAYVGPYMMRGACIVIVEGFAAYDQRRGFRRLRRALHEVQSTHQDYVDHNAACCGRRGFRRLRRALIEAHIMHKNYVTYIDFHPSFTSRAPPLMSGLKCGY